ncbi:MAG: ABC transporter permease [Anaerolineales bacterium]
MNQLRKSFRELLRYPSAVAGLIIILILVGVSIYALIAIPYDEAVRLWRGGEDVWYMNPQNVPPEWINLFRRNDLPGSFVLDSRSQENEDGTVVKETNAVSEEMTEVKITFSFDYPYEDYPQELVLYMNGYYTEKEPYIAISIITPDGRELRVTEMSIDQADTYRFSQDQRLQRRLRGLAPMVGIFSVPDTDPPVPLQGTYQVVLTGFTFEEGSDFDAQLVMHGKVAGWAGTDHRRRDLSVALLWGTPLALAFGLLAAIGTTVTTMVIAAIGVWFGGWVDELIQRITEVNLVLPFLPILIMIGTFYSKSIWLMLGATIALSIFGGAIKTYRAIFLQIKESPYIEAARAYGAGNFRIIVFYLVPRIVPLLIPTLVTLIPSYVFLEASLAVLGLGDPVLPTWGKVINDAQANGALYMGHYYWVLEPAILLMITGLAFALLGFAMDRIFNPRLRGV